MGTASTAPTHRTYHPLSISLHWLIVLCMIVTYTLIELHIVYPKGSDPREALKRWHETFGLTVFALALTQLIATRFFLYHPPIVPTPPAWQRALAAIVHLLLYIFLIGAPILGWLTLSAKGKIIPLYGLELPALMSINKPLGSRLESIHKVIGRLGYFLIALHTLAALFHHYIRRDNALTRMIPWLDRTAAPAP